MDLRNDLTAELFKAIKTLKTEDEFYSFFQDLCTIDELKEMSKRLQIAQLLAKGENYNEIREATEASLGTISRINKYYKYGRGGYKLVIDRLNKGE